MHYQIINMLFHIYCISVHLWKKDTDGHNCQDPDVCPQHLPLALLSSDVQTIQFVSNTNYHLLCLSLSCLMALSCLSTNWKETIYFYDLICISWVLCLQPLEHVNWFLWKFLVSSLVVCLICSMCQGPNYGIQILSWLKIITALTIFTSTGPLPENISWASHSS